MAKCVKCRQRKPKRYCAALEESICSLCCGLYREKEIPCPPSCVFLEKHKPYQDKRALEKKRPGRSPSLSPRKEILNDERLAWLAFNIEMPIAQTAEKDKSLTDQDVLTALDYARKKLEDTSRILIATDEAMRPKNSLGEAIFQSLERARFKKTIIVPGELQSYKKDEKHQCLERVSLSVKQVTAEGTGSRNYIRNLIERFTKIGDLSRQQKLITTQ